MLCLGGSYLALLLEHLQSLLTRGFQVHVLSVTVHGVLDALRLQLKPEHITSCLHNLLEVALNDIFGETSAEKEIDKIVAHTPEAKPSAKSYLTLHIAARNINENCLLDLLLPFKDQLARSQSRKVTQKIQDCFAKIVTGLVDNVHIPRESLLIFIYGVVSESITDLLPGNKKHVLSDKEKAIMKRARPDCFLLQPTPTRRIGAAGIGVNKQVKSNAQANAHILIEFGLEMLHIVLKRKNLTQVAYEPFVNPLLPLLRDGLKSTHARLTTFALKCFATIWNDGYELSALEEHLPDVVERMFEILKNFSTFGATRQEENAQLVRAAYKAIIALLLKCESCNLNPEQIQQLLLLIEQELHDIDANPTICLSLLKALVTRKINNKALHILMKQIIELSIVSHSDYIRDETRGILIIYLMEYPLHKRIEQIIKTMSAQLCYSVPSGRQSAIKFMQTVIKKFPTNILRKWAEFLYLSLGTRLVNDEDSDCRFAIAEVIEMLLARLTKAERQPLMDVTLVFFEQRNKPSVREMAAALLSRFVNVEKNGFASRLKLVLPTVVAAMAMNNPTAPGRFVRAPHAATNAREVHDVLISKRTKQKMFGEQQTLIDEHELSLTEAQIKEHRQRKLDHELIQIQYCLLKMLDNCADEMLSKEELAHVLDELAYESMKLLAHEHDWVRCNAVEIIANIIAKYDFEYVGQRLSSSGSDTVVLKKHLDFIYLNPVQDIKTLVLDLRAQIIPGETKQKMIDEISKVFLYVAYMLRDVPLKCLKVEDNDGDGDGDDVDNTKEEGPVQINLNWLLHNIRFLINKEVVRARHSTLVRTALFTLIEGFITMLNVDILRQLAATLLHTLVREMSEDDQNIDPELRRLALHVGSRLRKRIGAEIYDKVRNNIQMKLMQRRAERKKIVAQEKIHNPGIAAKRKAGIQQRKKVAKRLKASVMRGKVADTKQKLNRRKRKAEGDIF